MVLAVPVLHVLVLVVLAVLVLVVLAVLVVLVVVVLVVLAVVVLGLLRCCRAWERVGVVASVQHRRCPGGHPAPWAVANNGRS